MTLEKLVTDLNAATGFRGAELETATFLTAMLYADLMGNKEIADYYQGRMRESFADMQAGRR
jgi:hypothetical protein